MKRPGTFIDEFEGATEAEIRASRPKAIDLGSRRSTLYIFLVLILAALGLVVAAAFIYEDKALALFETVTGRPFFPELEGAGETTGGDDTDTATPPDLPLTPDLPPEPVIKPLQLGALEVSGQLGEDSVKGSIEQLKPALEGCLDEARGRAEEFSGSLTASFTIKSTRRASGFKAESSGDEDKKFESCIKKQITKAKFDKPKKGSVKVKQTLEY
ncbi:MAG: AgmX/PglI C-terminal domain-containing protein [Myxococcales bacterium]|nr:AgmX/PglI C-terminal domain-containing protein [Myxococcales bacterium]